MNVLIAEDDADARLRLENLLSEWGYEATACESGAQAWERYVAGRFHLVLCERSLPDINGPELCRKIRAASNQHCYFILLSSRTLRSDFAQEIDSGIDVLLTKPLDALELKRHLRIVESLVVLRSGAGRLLPLCAWCQRTRLGDDLWLPLDTKDADFTYSICPHCSGNLRPRGKSNSNQ